MTDSPAETAGLPRHEARLTLLDDGCACGCRLVACPECGDPRCLHCDPFCDTDGDVFTGHMCPYPQEVGRV